LKAELGMKKKKEEEESDDATFCSLKVPIDHEDKESKTYVVKIKTFDSGTPEELLKWRVNTSGKAGAQIPHPPLGDDSSPHGR
jgi:hypothetical protein